MAAPATSSIQNPSPSDSESVNIQAETEFKTDKKNETSLVEGRSPEESDEKPKADIKTGGSYEANQSPNEGKEGIMTEGSHATDQNPNEGKEGIMTEGSHEPDQNPSEGEEGIMTECSHETDQNSNEGERGEEEEEEGECGFCLFMKGGGCRDQFIAWENCVEEGETNKEDIVEKCYKVTSLLKECMDLHSDYYEPLLRAERAMDEEIAEEMKERESQETAQVKEPE